MEGKERCCGCFESRREKEENAESVRNVGVVI
jgi:hypothetical protein